MEHSYHSLKTTFVKNGEVKLHVRLGGSGPPLMFLHGFPDFSYSWRHQLPAFVGDNQVILPDLRGYHKSDKPKGVKQYGLSTLAADVIAILDDLEIEKTSLVGHDWGGGVAWTTAALYPERIERLIILNMPHPDEFRKQIFLNPRQFLRSYYALLFQLPKLPEWYFSKNPKWFFNTVFKKRSLKPEAITEEDINIYMAAYEDLETWEATINYYRAFFRYPYQPRPLPKIKVPVGLVWGEGDLALGKELTFKTGDYCENYMGIRYIKEASHWLQHEFPDEVNEGIHYFLTWKE
ncbi:MAG: alpha/beta hydrolase [Bacteroidota bacterium]